MVLFAFVVNSVCSDAWLSLDWRKCLWICKSWSLSRQKNREVKRPALWLSLYLVLQFCDAKESTSLFSQHRYLQCFSLVPKWTLLTLGGESPLMNLASILCASIFSSYFFLVKWSGICHLCLRRQLSLLVTLMLAVYQNSTRILVLAVKWLVRDGCSMLLLAFLHFFRHTHWEIVTLTILSTIPIIRLTNGIMVTR